MRDRDTKALREKKRDKEGARERIIGVQEQQQQQQLGNDAESERVRLKGEGAGG